MRVLAHEGRSFTMKTPFRETGPDPAAAKTAVGSAAPGYPAEKTASGTPFSGTGAGKNVAFGSTVPDAFPVPGRLSLDATGDADPSAEAYFCVFCDSGHEDSVVQALEYCGYGAALFPKRVRPVCRRGVWADELRALMPGYVFVRGQAVPLRPKSIVHVIRLLRYEDGTCLLRGSDRTFAETLFRGQGVIPRLETVQEGSFIRVTDPLLQDMAGKVLRVDRRKHLAEVEITITGTPHRIWLGLNIVEPAPDAKTNTDNS